MNEFEKYTNGCLETWGGNNKLERTVLGLNEEAGEVAGKAKKYLRGDYDLVEYSKIVKKELGDVLYYLAVCAHEHGFTLQDIADDNYNKLRDRANRGVIAGNGDNR
jgi:NTP pyrophosphatase (non-canonical NTP hydrolase)